MTDKTTRLERWNYYSSENILRYGVLVPVETKWTAKNKTIYLCGYLDAVENINCLHGGEWKFEEVLS